MSPYSNTSLEYVESLAAEAVKAVERNDFAGAVRGVAKAMVYLVDYLRAADGRFQNNGQQPEEPTG